MTTQALMPNRSAIASPHQDVMDIAQEFLLGDVAHVESGTGGGSPAMMTQQQTPETTRPAWTSSAHGVEKQALSITRPVQPDQFHASTLEERRLPAMDHGVEDCHRQAQSGSDARVVLEWLDTLSLCPPAGCWFCVCTDLPCQDVTANVVLTSNDFNDNVKRVWTMKLHESSHLVDGLCDVKPVIKRTIAAL
ncbi:hypothetical protein LZ31DRAFT_628551 [Colletotrichum somersetense]|nr:hypothetical protein LZ31DRAFT_628551 [Colletotrichum somersetense]